MEQGIPSGLHTGPFDALQLEHAVQLALCDCLEYIADGLPDSVDKRLAKSAATVLEQGFGTYVVFENEKLFPRVRERGEAAIAGALRQLEDEHVRDQSFAIEIAEELESLCTYAKCRNAEMLGYMLRGFFEGRRRHIAWENTVVIPVAKRVLQPQDLTDLDDWLKAVHWLDTCAKWRQALAETAAPGAVNGTIHRPK